MTLRTERAAITFAVKAAKDYGVESALARARRMRWEYPERRVPKWLQRAIGILIEMDCERANGKPFQHFMFEDRK